MKICLIIAGIKSYKSIINKKKKRHDKILSLTKSKLNSLAVLISNALIDSNISHDEFVFVNNIPKKTVTNKSLKYIKQCYILVCSVNETQKVKTEE